MERGLKVNILGFQNSKKTKTGFRAKKQKNKMESHPNSKNNSEKRLPPLKVNILNYSL